jgi:hypothetical protein
MDPINIPPMLAYMPAPAGSYVLIEVRHGRFIEYSWNIHGIFMEYMRIIRMTIPCESQPRFPSIPQDGWQASFPAMMGLVAFNGLNFGRNQHRCTGHVFQ